MLLVAAMMGCGAVEARAQLFWNTNGTNATWTAVNWGATAAGPFDAGWTNNSAARFTANSSITNVTNTPVGDITVDAGATVTLTAAGTYSTGGLVRTLDVGAGSTLDFAAQSISTAAGTGFIKNGAGTWISSNGNLYPGGFTLNAGTVAVGGVNALGSGGALTLNGGTVRSTSTNGRDLSGKFAGGITIGGDVAFGDATNTGSITFNNAVSLGAASRSITTNNASTLVIAGIVGGDAGVGITKLGAGSLDFTATSINTYTGDTFIRAGNVLARNASAFGSTGSVTLGATSGSSTAVLRLSTLTLSRPIIVASGTTGVLTINNLGASANPVLTGGITGTNNLTIQSIISSNGGSVTVNTSDINITGALRLENAGTGTNAAATGTVTISSVIGSSVTGLIVRDVTTGTRSVQKAVLSGANTYSGPTNLISGILQLGAADVIPNSSSLVLDGGTLDSNGFSETLGTLSISSGTSTLKFGVATGSNVLTFGGATFTAGTLSVTNWDGLATGGGADRFLVVGAPAVAAVNAVQFVNPLGFDPGTYGAATVDAGGGLFEIVPVPEPGSAAVLLIAAAGLGLRRRRRAC
ncbi:beta strand repeat-containing protein [Humisphaera borealis]|uniref:Autotransporter-associated beta strand repeat-containing protein n=1 Tax=Humisphaera borealis TaxID=2807512 RepID=A0A7M2WXK4_9BACT|nr:autotransporter-associated beta strand repeat-containing protein [Humisphaera borealis]QOV89240.1 autotransporter-associated beta strand repeat-containing protein [Humisphaera borealis]